MRRLCVVLLCACGTDGRQETSGGPTQAAEIRGDAPELPAALGDASIGAHDDTSSEVQVANKIAHPMRLWSGRHGGTISLIDIAADGSAAVTVDDHDHARLWPALDGSREPLVLPIEAPAHVEVQRLDDGFAIASLDAAGGLTVLDIDRENMLRGATKFGVDPPYAHVVATSAGFVAVRSDHHIELIDRTGKTTATLVPAYGERVASLLQAADHTLALVETPAGLLGAWIDVDAGSLAWGGRTPVMDFDATTVAISPDAARVAGLRTKRHVPAYAELATGEVKPISVPIDFGGNTVLVDDPMGDIFPTMMPRFHPRAPRATGRLLGFASTTQVVFDDIDGMSGLFVWYDTATKRWSDIRDDLKPDLFLERTTARGGRVIGSLHQDLVVITRNQLSYLGYDRLTARQLHESSAGVTANVGGTVLLDEQLRVDRRLQGDGVAVDTDLELRPIPGAAATIDPAWLEVQSTHVVPRTTARIALWDLAAKREVQKWPVANTRRPVQYDQVSQWMTIDHGKALEVALFDPVMKTFGESKKIALPTAITKLVMLDPALAGGEVAITMHGRELRRWRREDFETGTLPDAIVLDALPAAIDRAGHVVPKDRFKGWTLRPSRDGKLVAGFAKNSIMLADTSGTVLWTETLSDVRELAWTPNGTLIAQTRELVEISTSTGQVEYAQCGWSFGVRHTAREQLFETDPTICDR
ncbi:MAG TPA: hypothetical protein VL326_11335 [Kofleriaceae bacterium]|nr:hypothetical protein [Kofleriaceae bacterium]